MTRLEDLQPNAAVRGILPDSLVTVVSVQWFGSEALELTYKTPAGKVANELLYRHDETRIEVVELGRPWSFDGDGELFRLVSEAHRIRLAHLFDPVLAVHTSVVEPLLHQITAVYEEMLPRQPLRFLLADDPGAGKTIMAGLLIKELIARGDLQRCLVVCPGSLAEQWQDELYRRFHLPFEILTNDKLEAARTGNWFLETNLVIARLDKLSRNEDVQEKLKTPDCRWDLIVCDEAHKLSATFFGGEIKYTKRYRLGQLLSTLTRHFLLMTATPHDGKEEDFQLFMALLDGDRFEGRFRDGVHAADVSDLMRRMVKENLLKFDATPLFPERVAFTVPYELSNAEAQLYKAVTDYVRGEFNRAEALQNDRQAGTVGFALTILQRRLASSPEAIYQSLLSRWWRWVGCLHRFISTNFGQKANFRNTVVLVFLAADKARLQDLDEAVRRYLAWESILGDKELRDQLSQHQIKLAENQKTSADNTVIARIPEAYQWLLVPTQVTPQSAIEWQSSRLSGQDALAVRACKKLRTDELLVTALAGTRLRMELDRVPLWRGDHVPIKQLVEDFARYIYLPRLKDPTVLLASVRDGLGLLLWAQDSFAYADSFDESSGRYRGLRGGEAVAISETNQSGLLVRPDVAVKQLSAETAPPPVMIPGANEGAELIPLPKTADANASTGSSPAPKQSPAPKRFHGSVTLDATRVGRDAGRIADEAIAYLSGLVGANVKVTLEIEAEIPGGAPDNVVRTVTENSRTLKFSSHGFESD